MYINKNISDTRPFLVSDLLKDTISMPFRFCLSIIKLINPTCMLEKHCPILESILKFSYESLEGEL